MIYSWHATRQGTTNAGAALVSGNRVSLNCGLILRRFEAAFMEILLVLRIVSFTYPRSISSLIIFWNGTHSYFKGEYSPHSPLNKSLCRIEPLQPVDTTT